MSYKLVDQVIKHVGNITASEKLVLLAISQHVNNETGKAFPSINRIAKMVNRTSRTVLTLTANLREKGYLVTVGRTVQGVYVYKVRLPKSDEAVSLVTEIVSGGHEAASAPPLKKLPLNQEGEVKKGNQEMNSAHTGKEKAEKQISSDVCGKSVEKLEFSDIEDLWIPHSCPPTTAKAA